MGRIAKISKEVKLKVIKNYQSGIKSMSEIAKELGTYEANVRDWVKRYNSLGETAFDDKPKNKTYSKELKVQAINDYLSGKGSIKDISIKYGINSHTTLTNWIMKYNSHIEIKDYNPKGDVYMAKAKKTTFEERLEIVKYCLDNGKSYKLAAEHYEQPYHLIYQWVQKYLEEGEQCLTDNRGRNKTEEELSETDKLKRDKELLQAKIKRLEIENELLKKLQEIERREALIRSGKKQNMKR